MYLKLENEFGDVDLEFTRDFLEHLDIQLSKILTLIDESVDPDSEGLCDEGEYYIGVGFTIAQRYITPTRNWKLQRKRLLNQARELEMISHSLKR